MLYFKLYVLFYVLFLSQNDNILDAGLILINQKIIKHDCKIKYKKYVVFNQIKPKNTSQKAKNNKIKQMN